jgi:2,3-dihydroxybenzoate decarboxylase
MKGKKSKGETAKRAPVEKKPKARKISIEEHWKPRTTKAPALARDVNAAVMPHAVAGLSDFERRFPLMDESGIAMQVLAPAGIPLFENKREAVALTRQINDDLAEIIRKYSGRIAGYATLPIEDPKASARELERAVTGLGFKAAMVCGATNGEYLDEKKFWPIWEKAEELAVPIYVHPFDPPEENIKLYKGHPELMGPGWSWTVDTASHALRVIGAGVFDAFPKSILILGHMGETLPYLLGRLDEGYTMAHKTRKLKRLLSEYIRENIIVTTSGRYRPETLVCAISAMGIDRVLFAVDYPFVAPKDAVDQIESAPISDADKEKIYHLNAKKWLKLQ